MAISQNEALASLRILVCVVKADGVIHEEEKKALSAALEGMELPGGVTVESLLDEKPELDEQLKLIESGDAREEMFRSAYTMAYADGACSPEEEAVLDRIGKAYEVPAEQRTVLNRLFAEGKDTLLPTHILQIHDPEQRAREIREDVLKYSVLSAVLGAFPIPGLAIATDLGVVALQVKMIRDIGQYYGHTVDKKAAKTMLYGLGLGTGARLAVNNLAKLLPGWGSAVGAATSFASTFALGKVLDKFFADDNDPSKDIGSLKSFFKSAEKEGKAAYAASKDDIKAKEAANKDKLAALTADLKAGKIDQAEFDKGLSELA